MNAKLFINYRREDTGYAAGRLYDRLTAHFGEDQVFIDIDQIEPGEDFVEVINRKVGACDVAIVAIGPNWLGATDSSGKRRLDDAEDFVRMEIVAALQRKIRVIPVLVGGARMPGRHNLPEELTPLSRRNAIELSETRFHADVNRLIEAIEKSFAVAEREAELSATPAAPLQEPAAARPPEPESKDLPEPSGSTKPAEAKETKEIDASTVSATAPLSPGETTKQYSTQAAPPHRESERSQQSSVATARDPTAPVKSTKPTQSQTFISSVASTLGEIIVWVSEHRILVGAIVLLLLSYFGFLNWPRHQKAAKQGNQLAIANPERVIATATPVIANLNRPPGEAQFADQNAATNLNLGLRYERGDGVPQDSKKAAELYQKAADQGNAEAQQRLGSLYFTGLEGVPRDLKRAAELFQKAADQGYAEGQDSLGYCYFVGWGVPQDIGKAAELYQKAADQGNARGQYRLGSLYEDGNGVPQDISKAAELYQKAADQGDADAQKRLYKATILPKRK